MPELVNQPYQILRWVPLTLLACHCQRAEGKLNLIQVFGFSNATGCPQCGVLYTATGLTTEGVIVIQAVTPSKVVM
jgi:hypothetical protein